MARRGGCGIMAVVVLLVFIGLDSACGQVYDYSGQGFGIVPSDIPLNATEILLDYNQIDIIDTFGNFPGLLILNLISNKLIEFPNVTSVGSTLETLDLKKNFVSFIDPARLVLLTKLKNLYMTENSLTTFPQIPGANNAVLRLFLGSNMFSEIPTITQMMPNLRRFILDGNSLTNQNADVIDLTGKNNILDIILNSNHYEDIPWIIGDGAALLQKIQIQRNGLIRISKERLTQLTNLWYLHLANNPIAHFPDVAPLQNLKRLYLYWTDVPTFTHNDINRLSSTIGVVELGPGSGYTGPHNRLTTLPNLCRVKYSMTVRLNLNFAPLHCDCKLRWLKLAYSSGASLILESTPCHSPPALVGRTLDDIGIDEFVCDADVRTFRILKVKEGAYFCNNLPLNGRIHQVRTLTECATRCLKDPHCTFVRYPQIENDPTSCEVLSFLGNSTVTDPSLAENMTNMYTVF